jgi:hypothetical protein
MIAERGDLDLGPAGGFKNSYLFIEFNIFSVDRYGNHYQLNGYMIQDP